MICALCSKSKAHRRHKQGDGLHTIHTRKQLFPFSRKKIDTIKAAAERCRKMLREEMAELKASDDIEIARQKILEERDRVNREVNEQRAFIGSRFDSIRKKLDETGARLEREVRSMGEVRMP